MIIFSTIRSADFLTIIITANLTEQLELEPTDFQYGYVHTFFSPQSQKYSFWYVSDVHPLVLV